VAKKEQPASPEFKRVKLYYETFSTESGKAVLKDLRNSFYDAQSYVPGDPYATAFSEGCRSVVLGILNALKQSQHPELFEESLDEYSE